MWQQLSETWQDLSTNIQDLLIFFAYLAPVILLGGILLVGLRPLSMIKTLLKRYLKTNVLIIMILGVCLSVSIAIQATTSAYKTAMAKVANRFELVVTAPGSKTDMMLATVYLKPVATPLLMGDIYEKIARENNVAITAPIAYGDSYRGLPIVGSTNSFLKYLTNETVTGQYFSQRNQAIIGAGVDLKIGDTFIPQHGIHKSFADSYTDPNARIKTINTQKNKIPKVATFKQTTASQKVATLKNTKLAPQEVATSNNPPLDKVATSQTSENYFCPDSKSTRIQPLLKSNVANNDSQPKKVATLLNNKSRDFKKASESKSANELPNNHQAMITVVGKMPVTHSPWDKAIITPVESVWAIHGLPTGHAPEDETALGEPFDMDYFAGTPAILVHPKKRFHAYSLSKKYTSAQSMAFMPPTVLSKLNAQLDDMTDILSRVALVTIALVLSLAIVTIALLGKLFEKHFQLLQSLGSPQRFIVSIQWGYVTTLAFGATVLGCLLGYALSLGLANYIESQLSVLLVVQFGLVELTLCAMFFALTSVLGLMPALMKRD